MSVARQGSSASQPSNTFSIAHLLISSRDFSSVKTHTSSVSVCVCVSALSSEAFGAVTISYPHGKLSPWYQVMSGVIDPSLFGVTLSQIYLPGFATRLTGPLSPGPLPLSFQTDHHVIYACAVPSISEPATVQRRFVHVHVHACTVYI